MPESDRETQPSVNIKTRIRSTCIAHCGNYLVMKETAEAEQARLNAAVAAGHTISGKSVKIICPFTRDAECPAFVYAPVIGERKIGENAAESPVTQQSTETVKPGE